MSKKLSIELGSVQKTLVLPLWGRAVETRRRAPLLVDPAAARIIDSLDYDFSTIALNMNPTSQLAWIARCIHIDRTVKQFLTDHPRATVVNIGCGLDTTFERVDNGTLLWYDLDLPDVIRLRSELIPEGPRRKVLACSFLDQDWQERLELRESAVFVAAGVFYYFEEGQIRSFLQTLTGKFPGAEVIFDACSPLGARVANQLVIKAGGMDESAYLRWGLPSADSIRAWDRRIEVVEAYPIFKGVKRHLSMRNKMRTLLSDALRIMFMVHLRFAANPSSLQASPRAAEG